VSESLYQPSVMRVAAARQETPDTRTLRLEFTQEADRAAFFSKYRVGQFGLYGVPGAGESALCIASPPTRDACIECTFRRLGRVTTALADREVGQSITFRGPYGNAFPIDTWRGRSIMIVAGGIALPPLRSVLLNLLDRRGDFGDITLLYGAKTEADLVYKDELAEWAKRGDLRLVTTVDPGGEASGWQGKVGLVPAVLEELAPRGAGAVAIVGGPPVMIRFTLPVLAKLGFAPADTYTTLENRMKCGVGHCGRCNVGSKYVCRDGPVFTLEQLRQMQTADM
jgi:sulfhydrogenase subunit gamma (sulfur reductase)